MKTVAVLTLSALALVGCPKHQPAKPALTTGGATSLGQAQTSSDTASAAADTAESERLSKLRANVDAAAKAPNIEAAPVAQNEIIVAQGRLSDIKPDPQEIANAAERRALVEQGRATEARQNAVAAAEQGRKDAAELINLRAEAKRFAAERDRLASELVAQAERNRVENQKAINDAIAAAKKASDEQHNSMLKSQAGKLTWIGIWCISAAISIAVLVGFFGSLIVLRKVGLYLLALAVVGFLFLGAAQIIAQPWFMWACAGAILIGCIWFGVWAWRHQKRGDLAAELAARTTRVAAVAKTAVPVLDTAYESASAEVRAWLDANIFDRLSSAMNRDEKATVHEVRAEAKLTEAAAQ